MPRRPRRARRNSDLPRPLTRGELTRYAKLREQFLPGGDPEPDPYAPHLARQRAEFEQLVQLEFDRQLLTGADLRAHRPSWRRASDRVDVKPAASRQEVLDHLERTAHLRAPLTPAEHAEYESLRAGFIPSRQIQSLPPLQGRSPDVETDVERHRGWLEAARMAHAAAEQHLVELAASRAEQARLREWRKTPEGRAQQAAERQRWTATEQARLADVRKAEQAAQRERSAELAEYTEDTRTGPRPKMPDALDIGRLVQGPGAGFTIRDYPPQILNGNEHCGNPIDGKAYYFIVSRQSRATTQYVKWDTVERAAAAAGIEPAYTTFDVRLTNSGDRDVTLRRVLAQRFPDTTPALRELLFARAEVLVGQPGNLRPVRSGETISVSRADAGVQLRIVVPSGEYLAALHAFVEDTFIPEKKAAKIEVYPSRELPSHLIREKTSAKARRGLRPPGGAKLQRGLPAAGGVFERAEFIADVKGPQLLVDQRVEHDEFGSGKLEGFTTAPLLVDGVREPAAMVRFDKSKELKKVATRDLWAAPTDDALERQRELQQLESAEQAAGAAIERATQKFLEVSAREAAGLASPGELERALDARDAAREEQRARQEQRLQAQKRGRAARAEVTSSDFMAREGRGRARAPRKASVATSKGDLRVNYAIVERGSNQLTFFRQTKKGAAALNQFDHFKPFGPHEFTYRGPRTQLARALAQVGPISADIAAALAVSGCVRVDGVITLDPSAEVGPSTLSIRCEPKSSNEFFSWVPSYLPRRDDETDCVPRTERSALVEQARKQPHNYSVYVTLNPVLFEYTRAFWSTWRTRGVRREEEGILANAAVLRDIDTVGRYGAALRLAQIAASRTNNAAQMVATLQSFFAPAFGEKYLTALLSGSDSSKSGFVQLWPVGVPYGTARAQIVAFANNPTEWLLQFKRGAVDRALPRILRTYQVGMPNRKVWRLKPTSSRERLQRALYFAMHQSDLPPSQSLSDKEEARLLRAFQARPPTVQSRASSGKMELIAPAPLPATGEFDSATVAVLNRVLNAPKTPPRGARSIPEKQDLAAATTAAHFEAYLGTLQEAIRELDGALVQLGPTPYALRTDATLGPGLNLSRPGTKRRPTLE